MTTDAYPKPLYSPEAAVRPHLAQRVMHLATRIKWAEPEVRGLAAVVRPGDSVMDVGAAHGMYTLPLAHLVGPSGRVDSFEPHPRQQRTLRALRRIVGAEQISVNASAVGPMSGQRTMRLPIKNGFPIYGHAHVTEGAAPPKAGERTWQWRTAITSIDAWVANHGIARVSFIKVDVEGFEPQVVLGAAATIDSDLPSLLLEVEDRHLARYGHSANSFATSITTRWPEYTMYTWKGEAWTPTNEITLATRNYLFATDSAFARP